MPPSPYIDPHFPLVELHRHLDGNVRLSTILDIGLKHNLGLPADTVEGLRPYVQVVEPKPSILDFFQKFEWLTKAMVDTDACRRIAYENVEDAYNEGIDHIELRFSPLFMAETHQLDPAGVVAAVVEGVQEARRKLPIKVNLIGILTRTYGVEGAWQELNALLTRKDDIIALDLAGDELHFPGELFVEHFKKARDAGWHAAPHAGEALGPESVWQALRELGAERIGHAVHAVQDPALLDYLAEQQIGIESNLTSNVQTSTVLSYAAHPLKTFLERGIPATINTDDPGISAIDISYEYTMAVEKVGLSVEQVRQAQRNALAVAFLTEEEKQALVDDKR
ncbi:MAG TPA: adenosine deaminase [Anaerolineaceae bacterium]|uniref:adenosine deaminase n=1 Tax=Anaerolinea thermophila TaxID=167964 RepID=A0A117LH59_9CHLR|nr:MAG: Adenosine deaminase [Anaerolinea thermophila]HAF62794.1 adenosine deaminase [Anaerolineaceae bacterium]